MPRVTIPDLKAQVDDLEDFLKTALSETSREKLLSVVHEALYRVRNVSWGVEQLSRASGR